MMVSELLKRLSAEQLARLDQAPIWEPGIRWQEAVLNPDILIETLPKMSPYAERLLHHWVQSIGPIPINEEQLRARSVQEAGLAGAELRAAVRELRSSGILFAVRKSWGEQLLFLPSDSYLAWRRTLAVDPLGDLTVQNRYAVGYDAQIHYGDHDALVPLGRRLVRAYAALHKIGLDTTAKGLFSKKTAADIARITSLRNTEAFERMRPVYQDHYPLAFSIALDVAVSLGLIVHQEGGEQHWSWSHDAIEYWLDGDPQIREAELLRLFTIRYGSRSTTEAALASGLLLLKADESHRLDSLHPMLAQWIDAMCACGWASMTADLTGGWKFQWLVDPWADQIGQDNREPVMVLPDGELIVPPGASLKVRWQLEYAAQWIRDDAVTFYRITDKSVMAAAERGVTAEQLISELQHVSGDMPLPEELVHSIMHWMSRVGRTAIEQVMLLRCNSKEVADAAASRESLSALLQERLGDRTFIIRQSDEAHVRHELERAGWPPTRREQPSKPKEAAIAADNMRKPASRRAISNIAVPKGFIQDEHALYIYELLAANEQLAEELADTAPSEWPSAWTTQLRQYHPSTRKQIIEQALEWGAPLQLRTGGRLVELIPERLDDGIDSWAVAGFIRTEEAYEPVRLLPDMWEEMRLIIPL